MSEATGLSFAGGSDLATGSICAVFHCHDLRSVLSAGEPGSGPNSAFDVNDSLNEKDSGHVFFLLFMDFLNFCYPVLGST